MPLKEHSYTKNSATEKVLRSVYNVLKMSSSNSSSLLLAVSGGADSTVLAHAVYLLRSLGDSDAYGSVAGGRIAIAHVNFMLRGEDSVKDEEFVRELSAQLGFEFFTTTFDTLSYSRINKISVELAARQLRYNWFYRLAEQQGFDALLTAHNANDNAETLLLNLVRGSGRVGLGAISSYREQKIEGCRAGGNLYIIRPLLDCGRSLIEEYVAENGLSYCQDKTNFESRYSRNKIRNKVMPLLEEINPAAVKNMNEDIGRFRQMNRVFDRLIKKEIEALIQPSSFALAATLQKGEKISAKERSAVAVNWLNSRFLIASVDLHELVGKGDTGFWVAEILNRFSLGYNNDIISDIAQAIEHQKLTHSKTMSALSAKLFIGKQFVLTLERGEMNIYTPEIVNMAEVEPVVITQPGRFVFGVWEFELMVSDYVATITCSLQNADSKTNTVIELKLNPDTLQFPLLCRLPRPGERFAPFGLRGTKKIADYLNSKKIPLLYKPLFPLLLTLHQQHTALLQHTQPSKKEESIVALLPIEISQTQTLP
ncbi:MAG: tRNA lysidine(34) synthetase TilS [Bacteroidales bacterium]|nr:tRNA lysidine(34) synthetase TilS [Bacteroidales bacterium]